MHAHAPCSAQHPTEEVFRILEVGDEIDTPAPRRMLIQQGVQEPQSAEILERETDRVEYRYLCWITAPGFLLPHHVREFDDREIGRQLLNLPLDP